MSDDVQATDILVRTADPGLLDRTVQQLGPAIVIPVPAGAAIRGIKMATQTAFTGATVSAASPTTSSSADPVVVTSGAPQARASTAFRPKPSASDGYATTAARRNSGATTESGR